MATVFWVKGRIILPDSAKGWLEKIAWHSFGFI
jgi:hypothetical protein